MLSTWPFLGGEPSTLLTYRTMPAQVAQKGNSLKVSSAVEIRPTSIILASQSIRDTIPLLSSDSGQY